MTVTLKEFAQFIQEFINKNFLPHLQSGTPQQQKSLQRWRQVSEMIRDLQKVNIWNLQGCLKTLQPRSSTNHEKDSRQYKKNQNSRPNAITYNTEYNFYDKKEPLPSPYALEEQTKLNTNPRGNSKQGSQPRNKLYKYGEDYQTRLSFENKQAKEKSESVSDPEGFQKLIQSFRKLCTNFENNHKKLLKEDQNYKQNYKEESIEH